MSPTTRTPPKPTYLFSRVADEVRRHGLDPSDPASALNLRRPGLEDQRAEYAADKKAQLAFMKETIKARSGR